MQTFLPYQSFLQSAKVLDRQRLGKQRVECLQIFNALANPDYGWQSHPAVTMWRGHADALYMYSIAMITEWTSRGYKDTCYDKITNVWRTLPMGTSPAWLGREDLHASHRSNLLRKLPAWYGQYGWTEPATLPYVWVA